MASENKQHGNMAFSNANVVTMDQSQPRAECIATSGGSILLVGLIKDLGKLAAGIRLEPEVKAEAITKSGVKGVRGGLYSEFFEADTVVLSMGMVPSDAMARTLEGKVCSVLKIGGAAKPAGVTEAMESAFRTALQI